MVGVTALGVRRRRAALAVLLRRQVLAAGRRGGRERLRVVVEVAGVALDGGAGLDGSPPSWRVVAVAHVGAAGGGGRGKVAVGVGPVAENRELLINSLIGLKSTTDLIVTEDWVKPPVN